VIKGTTQKLTAAVTGTNSPAQTVTWSITNAWVAGTTISADGVLTIAEGEYSSGIIVRATSTIDTSKFGTATVIPKNPPRISSVHVRPYIPTVQRGDTQQFTVEIVGSYDPPETVTWKLSGNSSPDTVISAAGGLLTVALDETADRITVTATSTFDTTKSGDTVVNLRNPPATVTGVTVTPSAIHMKKGEMQLFAASVEGLFNPAQTVTWRVEGNTSNGTVINAGVLFIASNETAATLTVRATSTADTGKSGTAAVTIAGIPPHLGQVSGGDQLSITDARMVLQYLVGKMNLTEEQLDIANVSGNETVGVTDARLILQKLVGKINKFPREQ